MTQTRTRPPDPKSAHWWRLSPITFVFYVIVGVAVLAAVFVPWLADPSASEVDPSRRFLGIGDGAMLGTDHLGRSLAVMVASGLRTSLLIALAVVVISGVMGWVIGAVSAYLGGFADNVLGRVMDLFNAFPGLILAIALVTALGPSFWTLVFVLVVATWVNYARVIRARVMSLKHDEYITASRMYGTATSRLLARHIWPNTADLALSVSLVQIPNVMLAESTISFLGFGLQPPSVSLGLLISSEKDYLQTNGLPVIVAGAVLVIVCASIAAVGIDIRRRWS